MNNPKEPKQKVWHEIQLEEARKQHQPYVTDEKGNKRQPMPPIGPFKVPTNQVERGAAWSEKLAKEYHCTHCENKYVVMPLSKNTLFCSDRCERSHVWTSSQKEDLRRNNPDKYMELVTSGTF